MNLASQLVEVKGVGEKLASLLKRLGLNTVEELIWHIPRRYEDYSEITAIGHIKPGMITVEAQIKSINARYVRRGLHITNAVASDDTGSVSVVWFNQPYRKNGLKPGAKYYLSGQFEFANSRYVISNPACELVSDFPKNSARIVPIYRETKGLTSAQIRKILAGCMILINELEEDLPPELIADFELTSLGFALKNIHFPESREALEQARKRLAFDEIFGVMLANALIKKDNQNAKANRVKFDVELAKLFVKDLGFDLTDAQRRAAWEILQDMDKTVPMNRLIEGDVGSGKTVVAAMAVAMCANSGKQSVLVAPTEILAFQHFKNLQKMLTVSSLKIELLSGSLTPPQKKSIKQDLKIGKIDLVIGTHAVFEKDVEFNDLSLAVIDEQHRFGVNQRRQLQVKSKLRHMPHLLSMTATPIPRTLALTVFSELDISIIDELPAGRKPIITKLISPNSRKQLFEAVDKQIDEGRQVFMVYPLIEESENVDARDLTNAFQHISKNHFKNRRCGFMHGKLKAEEKNQIMERFLRGELDILVTTTVIEVGVDVPNATVMVIESAERFGLAQLHQLRGRVGRSEHQAYCFLVPTTSAEPNQRLKKFAATNDGFKLAEIDLQLRGPGEIYGAMQHGALDLRVAKLSDAHLISQSRKAVNWFMNSGLVLGDYGQLAAKVESLKTLTYLN